MAEHRDAPLLATGPPQGAWSVRCGGCVRGTCASHKVKQRDVSIRDTRQKTWRGHIEAAFGCFWCLGALWPTKSLYACKSSTKHTQTDPNGMRQARQEGPGDKFPPKRPRIQVSSAPLCPQAFPDRPIEWVTLPDSNTMWQRDLETDVPCHWRDADGEMVPDVHTDMSTQTEGERDRVLELRYWEEERRSSGGWGWWRAVKGEINQVKAICGNACCSVIKNPVTQRLVWAVSRHRLTAGQTGILIFFSPRLTAPPQIHSLTTTLPIAAIQTNPRFN